MERMLSENDEQSMVSSFLEIAAGQTAETARQFLQATSWKLEDAIQLFYVGNEGGAVASASHPPPTETWPEVLESGLKDLENEKVGQSDGEEVRAPLPVVRDTLYDDAMLYGAPRTGYPPHEASSLIAFRNFDEEMKHPGVWESDQGSTSTTDNSRDNLASLYRPPFHLMFHGSFEKVYDDTSEGRKVCTYYKLDSIPVVLIIDPITGQKMHSWVGMVQPESLLEDLVPFMDGGPRDHHKTLSHKRQRGSTLTPPKSKALVSAYETKEEDEEVLRALAASMESMKDSSVIASNKKDIASNDKDDASTAKGEEKCSTRTPTYPPLPEEPSGDKSLLCRVGIRLPDGRRVQRNFLKTDPIRLLWSFCYSQLEEAGTKLFCLKEAIPGAKRLDYDSTMTFGDSGLANSMISVAWE